MTVDLKALIRSIPDYPKPGIIFRDITSLIEDSDGFRTSVERLAAAHRGVGFVPVRKAGKLPGETMGQNYALEYGVDTIEIHADAVDSGDTVLLVDDLIATGGTAVAAVALLRRTGASVRHAAFVIDLPDIGGAARLRAMDMAVTTLVSFEGH